VCSCVSENAASEDSDTLTCEQMFRAPFLAAVEKESKKCAACHKFFKRGEILKRT
jgi:hypothetical protein